LKAAADEVGVDVVGMDDEEIFGRPLHTLSFGEAIERNLLTDYQVVIVGVDDAMIAEWIKNRRIVGTDTGLETDAQALATQIGLIKAIKDYGLRRIISFHNRVKRAAEFAQEIPLVLEWLDPQHKPIGTVTTDHVSGAMSAIARRQKLSRLKHINEGEVFILSNARCLSEGVDVPSLDGVAFVDPRSSQIDIVQAVGRAIRLSKDKAKGTIVVPFFVESSDDVEQAILSSNFKPIWQILDALKAHDDVLSSQLDTLRTELGRETRSSIGVRDLQKVVFDLPATVTSAFADALRLQLVERTTESWFWWLGLLQRFKAQFGHVLVPMAHVTEQGHRLGQWVAVQRRSRQDLSSNRRAELDAEGFVWDVADERWDGAYRRLNDFFEANNTSVVPQDYVCDDGFELGVWVSRQRLLRQTLSVVQRARLEKLRFIWNVTEENWEQAYRRLEQFVLSHGHANVPFEWNSTDGFRLGRWVGGMRGRFSLLTPAQVEKLDKVGFVWDANSEKWNTAFDDLKAYALERGHCRVPQDFVSRNGVKLGRWVSRQRQLIDTLSSDKRSRLDGLGFVWDVAAAQWDDAFKRLKTFAEREGHCKVPALHKSDDQFRLGEWVREQRANRKLLTADQVRQLNGLGFVWTIRKTSPN
jgi:hypothetical protein